MDLPRYIVEGLKVAMRHHFRCCVAAFLFVQFLQTLKSFGEGVVFSGFSPATI